MHIYHSYTFTQEQEDKMREMMKKRNAQFGYNNRSADSENRWIGIAGEITLLDWFNHTPWADEVISRFHPTKLDDTDFDFGKLRIDVKISAKKAEPVDWDFLYIYETQYERIFEKNITNTLVFGFYILPERRCVLVGCMTLRDFDDNRKFYKAGEGRFLNSQYTLSTNDYAVGIGSAEQKGILLPLLALDQLR